MRHVRHLLHFSVQLVWMASCFNSPTFSANSKPEPITDTSVAHFRIAGERMLVVPVMLNGKGPFDFVLDTGSSRTMIDPTLASELAIKTFGVEDVTSIMRSFHIPLGRLDEISVATAAVRGMQVGIVSLKGLKSTRAHARGILGEDFCSHFDFLLDNRHRTLTFEKSRNEMLPWIRGERLDVRQRGNVEGFATEHRLIITIRSAELGGKGLSFQIDSGATLPVLFPGPATTIGSELEPLVALASTADCDACSTFRVRRLRVLQVGKKLLSGILVAMPDTREKMDTDGLLPTSLFQSIYINHSASFVVVNPEVIHDPGEDVQSKMETAASPSGQL